MSKKMSKFAVGDIVRIKKSATLGIDRPDGICDMSRDKRLGVIIDLDEDGCWVFSVGVICDARVWFYTYDMLKEVQDGDYY